jgi:hypothetical protein
VRSAPADGIAVRYDQAGLKVSDQKAVTASLTIDWLVVPGPSWVIVRADNGAMAPGPIIGKAHVDAGESTNVQIAVEATPLPHAAVATLIADRGQPGVLEFASAMPPSGSAGGATASSADKPYVADGAVVSYPFAIAGLSSKVGSGDATIGPTARSASGSSVTAEYVKAPGQSWLVISVATMSGAPGRIVGFAIVPPGVTQPVTVPLQIPTREVPLVATLHADLGQAGKFEHSIADIGGSKDQPYVAGGQTVQKQVPRVP